MSVNKRGTRITQERPSYEIEATVMALARHFEHVDGAIACFLECRQVHSKGFYRQLTNEFGVEIIKGGNANWVKKIAQLIFGYPAVVVVSNSKQIPGIFSAIVEQAFGGLYFFNIEFLARFRACAAATPVDLESEIQDDPSHFMYFFDEDSAVDSDLVTEIIGFGKNCDTELLSLFDIGQARNIMTPPR